MANSKDASTDTFTCFFYGTLMNVDILCRVIGTSHGHLEFADALLKDYTRHHVKNADYPAVVSADKGRKIVGRQLTDDEASVRGTVVRGLSRSDIQFLDTFEGDEYFRQKVEVTLLSGFKDADSETDASEIDNVDTRTQAYVYLWTAPTSMLAPTLWSYDEFMREKAHLWIGNGHSDAEYAEVDRRRQMEGKIVHEKNGEHIPELGHAIRKEWNFAHDLVHLNHGALGAPPNKVVAAQRKWQDLTEQNPDEFFRRTYFTALKPISARVASYLNAPAECLAFVLNATTGVNIVVRSLRWQKGDRILYFPNAVYGACFNTLQYVVDRNPDLELQLVPIDFVLPESDASIINKTREVIEKTQAQLGPNERIRMGLIDSIVSRPGVALPWQQLCALYKEFSILSVVDAAHSMGQQPIDLSRADPDFWVSNIHKWCYAPRSLAAFYVPERNHHLIETFPTSFGYKTSKTPKTSHFPTSFKFEFSYTGTQDVSALMAVPDALDFRLACGGDKRIMDYCHDLAVRGSKLMAERLGTEVMQNEEQTHIAAMANIRIPLPEALQVQSKLDSVADKINWKLNDHYKIANTMFAYDGKVWIRISAQIYNEIGDFEYAAKCLLEILEKPELLE